ncbi:MAG: T9SS type A sorting domain-containing protein [Bacteroidales bacterium]|jgi:hypothetical protein|nr:T9SS type A sorting domain-containing protein [Bacteroidales bacterium]
MKKYCLLGVLAWGYAALLQGQLPATVMLDHNPVLRDRHAPITGKSVQDTLPLPFIDDFCYYYRSPFPDADLWTDRHVFINNNFPIQPRSNGVATFDALDANGQIYPNDGSFYADTLTSCPVALENSMTGVYLSFFYQPQGYGDAPEKGDSLILQFKSSSEEWRNVWQMEGAPLHPFRQAMVPLKQEYLYKGFRFRFVNRVSFGNDKFNEGKKSNVDLWHIDYVRLDGNRHAQDTAIVDVSMIAPVRSLIKDYRSIPWNQFKVAYISKQEPQIGISYRNNDVTGYLVTRGFRVTDLYSGQSAPIGSPGSENIEGGQIVTYHEMVFNPFGSAATDSALFELKGFLTTSEYDINKENDTVRFHQIFNNYFARDDGIPESGYGYEGINAQGCAVACRYETFTPDTLRAVALYFNPVRNNVTSRYVFRIAVWSDDNGVPGEQVYLSQEEYSPKETGQFTVYRMERPVNITKYYWVGWQQVTSGFLNAGFDMNFNDKGNLWYNRSGKWEQDINDGTLMIRPFTGRKIDLPTASPDTERSVRAELQIYPNPATHYIYITFEQKYPLQEYQLEIYGVAGQLHYRKALAETGVDVGFLEQGLYIVRLVHGKTGQTWRQRLVIVR